MEEYIGILKIFAGSFAPKGYMLCEGQLLSIAQYSALYSILGTVYGGNGTTTFALPDLRGLTPVGTGRSRVSGTEFKSGEVGGAETTTINTSNLPPHQHNPVMHASMANAAYSQPTASSVLATAVKPLGRELESVYAFTDATPDIEMSSAGITESLVGGGMPFKNMQPYIAMNYIICTEGLYPSRP